MPDRPNILFIFADQLRYDALGVSGHPVAITPNIDRLAREGTFFRQCYSTNPVCLPARASIITGKYCHDHHCHDNGQVLAADETCWPALLRDSGYLTSIVGKLHLWEQWRTPCHSAVDHGFQYCQTVEGKNSFSSRVEESGWYYEYLRDQGLPLPARAAFDPECLHYLKARISEYDEADHIDGLITTRAIRQIVDGPRRDLPFCMQVGICSPHEFYDPPQGFFDMYEGVDLPDPVYDQAELAQKSPAFRDFQAKQREAHGLAPEGNSSADRERMDFMRRCYLANVTFVDHQVGRLVEALKTAGIYENTAIVLVSDHGEYTGDYGAIQKGMFLYELNVHVPLVIRAPGVGQVPGVSDSPVQNLDIFATMLDLAGLPLPAHSYSRSLLPALRDPAAIIRDAAFAETFDRKMVRQGDWKLIVDDSPLGVELYNLAEDPRERHNLARAAADPTAPTRDPEAMAVIVRLLRRLVQWHVETENSG